MSIGIADGVEREMSSKVAIMTNLLLLLLVFLQLASRVSAAGVCETAVKGVPGGLGAYRPQCKSDGSYEPQQCHGSTGYCWCVDPLTGKEKNGTRKAPGTGYHKCDDLPCEPPSIYFTNRTSILCVPVNETTGLLLTQTPKKLYHSDGLIRTLGVDTVNKVVYWGDLRHNTIHKMSLHGIRGESEGHAQLLFSYAIGYVQGIVVDYTSNVFYWTDSLMKTVEVADTNGFNRKVLFKLHGKAEPRGITLDPKTGHLFWTDWGAIPKIERSTLCGHNRTTIVTTGLMWPNDLGVDHTTGRVYWIDAYYDRIESVTTDGGDRRSYKISYNSPHPYSMTFSPLLNTTYWTDWLINSIYAYSPGKFGTTSQLIYHKAQYNYKSIGQLRVLEDLSLVNVSKPCLTLSGANKCSHLCLRESAHDHMCSCPTGHTFARSSMTQCQPATRSYKIYFADSHEQSVNHVIKYDGQDGFTIRPLVMPSNERVEYPVALDYDPYDGFLYWNDHRTLKTYRMHENGSDFSVVLRDPIKASSGIAFHKISKLLYFFVVEGKQISLVVTDSKGQNRQTLVTGKFTRPRDIAISEDEGLIFFTDINCVGRVNMDGTGLTCYRGTTHAIYPIGVTVDHVEKRVYWCDSKFYSISSLDFNFDRTNVQLVIQQTFYHRLRFWLVVNLGYVVSPHSIAVLGEKVFWTDLKKQAIFSADKRGGSNIEYVTAGLKKPRDLHVYSDKEENQYRKTYMFSYLLRTQDRSYCFSTNQCSSNRLKSPAPCPLGYKEKFDRTVCRNCSEAFGANFKCFCTDPTSCAQKAYSKIKGCTPARPFMKFRVRECVQTVKPGFCSYKLLTDNSSTCAQVHTCTSDDDCNGDGKCCETSCGKQCSPPVKQPDHPCLVNRGGCSHFCVAKRSSYQCQCPDGMQIHDVNKKRCVITPVSQANSTVTPSLIETTARKTAAKMIQTTTKTVTQKTITLKTIASVKTTQTTKVTTVSATTTTKAPTFASASSATPTSKCGKQCGPTISDDPCSVTKGGCSHHCIKKPNSYQCMCPDNMVIDVDGKTCVSNTTTTPPPAKRHLCMLPKHVGSCHPLHPATRWYHNPVSRRCEEFLWGGCSKNQNNFPTLELCEQVCNKAMDCHEPIEVGLCRAKIERWYFQPSTSTCTTFQWGGCNPGGNNFMTRGECMKQCHPTSSCDDTCYHGGSCTVLSDGYSTQCRCQPPWYGASCENNAEDQMVTVTFQRISRMEFTEVELKQQIADMLNRFCSKYPERCRFVPPPDRTRKRRSSPSTAFTVDNILIQNITKTEGEVEVTFAVIQPAAQQRHPGVLSSKSVVETLSWNPGRTALAGNLGLTARKYSVSSPSRDSRKKKKSSTPAIVLTILVAALLICITGYIYYRKKEMSRRAASVVSPRSRSVEERASNMLERAYNNCSTFVSNTIQNIRLRDRLPNSAGDSNITHTAFENELYDDIMNPVQQGRMWSQETNNNMNNNNINNNNNNINSRISENDGPIRTLANPAYATTSPYENISSPVKTNPTTAPTSSSTSKPPITEWVQFTDDDEQVMGPGFADAARLDLQFDDPYNIDPGSTAAQLRTPAPVYASLNNNTSGATLSSAESSGYVELPRYNEPSLPGLNMNTSAQQVQYASTPEQQYATIPMDSSHTTNS